MQNTVSATSPGASHTKSVKLVLRSKAATKAQTDLPPGTPLDVLSQELPSRDFEDQVPLDVIIDRLVQDAYARLVELSDTCVDTFFVPCGDYNLCVLLLQTPWECTASSSERSGSLCCRDS